MKKRRRQLYLCMKRKKNSGTEKLLLARTGVTRCEQAESREKGVSQWVIPDTRASLSSGRDGRGKTARGGQKRRGGGTWIWGGFLLNQYTKGF